MLSHKANVCSESKVYAIDRVFFLLFYSKLYIGLYLAFLTAMEKNDII